MVTAQPPTAAAQTPPTLEQEHFPQPLQAQPYRPTEPLSEPSKSNARIAKHATSSSKAKLPPAEEDHSQQPSHERRRVLEDCLYLTQSPTYTVSHLKSHTPFGST